MRLSEAATTVRSKNAGVDLVTFDIILKDRAAFERAKASPHLQPDGICRLFRIPPERLYSYVVFEPALAIKFTIRRLRPSGSPGETDVFGAQQYGPLMDLEI